MRGSLIILLFLTACSPSLSPFGAIERKTIEYQQGEALMNDCYQRQQRCNEWLAFKADWEARLNNVTTFERSLAAHKARVAAGGSV